MAFTKVTDPVNNVSNLANQPVDSPTTLKAVFDEVGKDLKTYINDTLTVELERITDGDSGADNIGATALTGGTATTVQGVVEELDSKIVSLLPFPDGSITDAKLSNTAGQIKDVVLNHSNIIGISLTDFVDVSEALAYIGASKKTLVISKNTSITTNTVIPSNVTLSFAFPYKITISNLITLTLNCNIVAPDYLIFDGAGILIVQNNALNKIESRWFGTKYGIANTILGLNAGNNLVENFNVATSEGDYNTAIGYLSQNVAKTPIGSTSVGFASLSKHQSGVYNTAIGYSAMRETTSGEFNTAIGSGTLQEGLNSNYNTAVGFGALRDHNGGNNNTAVGRDAMRQAVSGELNTAIGSRALYVCIGSNNTAVGERAAYGFISGGENVFVGDVLGGALTSGSYNVLIGGQASQNKTVGSGTVAVGYVAGIGETTGGQNVFVGRESGISGDGSLTYATAIGAKAKVSASNSMSLGAPAGQTGEVNVGIGVAAPSEKLHVYGRIAMQQGSTAPATHTGFATMWVDPSGALKLTLSDGTVKTITMT